VRSGDHEIPHYAISSSFLLLRVSWAQPEFSAPYSQTTSTYVRLSMWEAKFYTQTKMKTIFRLILLFAFLDGKLEFRRDCDIIMQVKWLNGWKMHTKFYFNHREKTRERNFWQTLVKTVMNFLIPWKTRKNPTFWEYYLLKNELKVGELFWLRRNNS